MSKGRALLAALAIMLGLAPTHAARPAEAVCPGVSLRGDWASVATPNFPSGPQEITSLAVHPLNAGTMLVGNGSSLMTTDDGGCNWETSPALPALPTLEVPITSAAGTITDIAIAPAQEPLAYALVEERLGAVVRPHVLVSLDGGRSWSASDDGLPAVSGPTTSIRIAPSNPQVVYVMLTDNAVSGKVIYASTDGGLTWERRADFNTSIAALDFVIDPLVPQSLWSWGAGLFHSFDGGRSWQLDERLPGMVLADVFHAPGEPARIMAYEPEGFDWYRSDDGGATWLPIRGPSGSALSIASGRNKDSMLYSLHEGVYRFSSPYFWIDVTPPDYEDENLRDLQSDATGLVVGRTASGLMVYGGLEFDIDAGDFDVRPADVVDSSARLQPERRRVTIAPGQRRTLKYRLELPPTPTPLDVFFIVDTTDSMQSSINGLRQGLQRVVDELAGIGIDARFGVAEYKDYPIAAYGDAIAGDRPYVLRRVIGPADQSLAEAMASLQASGGGDFPESQLTALHQAATGEGDLAGQVPPGGQAGFRSNALPVIVNITDAAFHDGAQHPSPAFDSVATELRSLGILQIGLAVYGPQGSEGAYADLSRMAEATRTLTPPGGVDCDGDGTKDLSAGLPLVCEVSDAAGQEVDSLAPAIVATLKAVRDEVPVDLVPVGGGRLVDGIEPALLPAVDVKEPQRLIFEVTLSCPPIAAGSTHALRMAARVRERAVALSSVSVRCLPPSAALEEVPPLPLVPPKPEPVAAAVPLPPAPPPAATENIPAQQPNAQAAVVAQEQEQPQLAYVAALGRWEGVQEEFAFSTYKSRPAPGVPWLAGAAAALMAAGVMVWRARPVTARNYVRRRRPY